MADVHFCSSGPKKGWDVFSDISEMSWRPNVPFVSIFRPGQKRKEKEKRIRKNNHSAVITSKNYFNWFQNPRLLSPPIVCGLFLSRDHLFGTNKEKGFNNRSSLSPNWFKFSNKSINHKTIIRTLCACYENHSHQLKGKYDGWIMEQRLAARNREENILLWGQTTLSGGNPSGAQIRLYMDVFHSTHDIPAQKSKPIK